jgi:hypothetical protein
MMNDCNHEWPERSGTVRCERCQAVGFFDKAKDPFNTSPPVILKPSEKDWRELSGKAKHHIFEKNRNHILIDLQQIGRAKTCEKWSMANSTLAQLLEAWEGKPRVTVKSPPSPHPELPPLPPFNPDWLPEVQIKWLEVYGLLLQKKK